MDQLTHRRFTGQVALITGAASGIGAASARRFALEGAAVIVLDIDDRSGLSVVDEIRSAGGQAEFWQGDVGSATMWTTLGEHLRADYGGLDVLHCNAFTVVVKPAHDLSEVEWDQQLTVSLKGAWLGVREFADALTSRGGNIVLTSSVHANFGMPGHPAYAAAKGALCALGRQLAVEYGPTVRVNTVLPGPILTAAWDRVDASARVATAADTVAGRLGTPEEVAAAVAFLASPEASYITGAELVVDGGWSIVKVASS